MRKNSYFITVKPISLLPKGEILFRLFINLDLDETIFDSLELENGWFKSLFEKRISKDFYSSEEALKELDIILNFLEKLDSDLILEKTKEFKAKLSRFNFNVSEEVFDR